MTITAGYDVGGAHLKFALIEDGAIIYAAQIACPLWRGLDQLDVALAAAAPQAARAKNHCVTMTGELADVFPDRYTGVALIIERITAALGPDTRIWMGKRGFGTPAQALIHHTDAASANFLATATCAARRTSDGLLIDMGSTTTDIVALIGGKPAPHGLTDADRLRTGELVYSGLTRTSVMAVTTRGLFQGRWQSLARDPFANMADVRRVIADLPNDVDQHATADGRGKSQSESRARLARCFGRDAEPGDETAWLAAARHIAEEQIRSIHDGCIQTLSIGGAATPTNVITAGIGSHTLGEVAHRLGATPVTFGELVAAPAEWRDWATRCAPAVAVAILGQPSGSV